MGVGVAVLVLALVLAGQPRPGCAARTDVLSRRMNAGARALVDRALRLLSRKPEPDPVVELCAGLCAELRAGVPAGAALIEVAGDVGVAPRARSAALLGEPVADALLADAEGPGRHELTAVAACWRVAGHTGMGLVAGLERVAALARSRRRIAQDLAAETAAPRASARVLTLLPVSGVLLGQLLGIDPLGWLVGDALGLGCLAAGTVLLLTGRWWVRRILRSALPASSTGRR